MKRILIPVDGSPASMEAVSAAVREGPGSIERVELVNVQPHFDRYVATFVSRAARDGWRADRARRALEPARRRIEASGIPCRAHMAVGPIAPEIVSAARSLAVDEIVVGARRRGALARLLANSVTGRLLELSEVPLRIVPGARSRTFERIALPAGLGLAALLLLAQD